MYVTSVELSMAAVEAAILKQDKLHLNKIHQCVADLRQTRFPESYFDMIFVRETVEFISSKAPVLTEFLVSFCFLYYARICSLFFFVQHWLKPGSKLLLSDYCLSHRKLSDSIGSLLERDGLQLEKESVYVKVSG